MSYKDKFYAKYYSTHIVGRKGEATLAEFKHRATYFQQRWRHFLPVHKDAHIIDVGCGNGSVVWWLQQAGYTYAEGIDISAEQIAIAKRLGVQNVCQADLKSFLADKYVHYDVIILRDVIEHFTREEILEILETCFAAIKVAGKIVIQVPNAESPFFGRIRYGDFTHEIAFSTSSLQQLLQVIGFSKVVTYPVEPAVTNVKSFLRFGLWKAVAAFYRLLLFAELGHGPRVVTQGIIAVGTKMATESCELGA
jgi:2-polyprenyl-3-methyl-5-hydroxy-6-metoxy-1,4-benzoquinol methylase